jgi:hypothetical protein
MKTWTWNEAKYDGILPKEWLNLSDADLSDADLSGADLSDANLSDADLSDADLRRADLRRADLRRADLSDANLSDADLSDANLRRADLRRANLSDARGLLSAADWLKENFACTENGVVVYKRLGVTEYNTPQNWVIAENSVIMEVCNPCRTYDCACGINFGTRQWVDCHYQGADIWECLIEWHDLAGVIVPYHTNGKARCERLTLLRKIS